MSVLVVQIPPRQRLSARAAGGEEAPPASGAGIDFAYVLSTDLLVPTAQGRAAPSLLPKADTVVAVLADADVAWHRITMPKAPAAKLRAALSGLLEEALLEEPEGLHLALAPNATAGQSAWVAVVHKAWLAARLEALDKAGVAVDRVVPSAWPGDAPQGHFFDAAADAGGAPDPALTLADVNGLVSLPLAGTLARALLPAMAAQPTHWTTTPAVAAPAERWLGTPITVQTEAERTLQAARSLWNLRQFDLTPRRRGSRALRDVGKRFLSPGWRPVRVGLVALAALQLVGLNAWAWAQRRAIDDKRQAQIAVLKTTHPQVRAVLDAPLQMQRETDTLRMAAGRPGEGDLEALLSAAAAAWPDGQAPVQGLRFEPGQLTLAAPGWTDDQARAFRERLRPGGWAAEYNQGRMTINRSPVPGARGS
jgi:general secretion pathway protein L